MIEGSSYTSEGMVREFQRERRICKSLTSKLRRRVLEQEWYLRKNRDIQEPNCFNTTSYIKELGLYSKSSAAIGRKRMTK